MDARLREKYEARAKLGFLKKKDRIEVLSERFEEAVQELVEGTGMQYQPHPKVNSKTPDGVIFHENGRTYIEAVCSQGPEEFDDARGESDLCIMLSPRLIEQNLTIHLSYETTEEDEWGFEHVRRDATLEDPLSKADTESAFAQVQAMTSQPSDKYGGWSGEIEIRGRKLGVHAWKRSSEPIQVHIGHCSCAVGFTKNASKGGHISDHFKDDRKRIIRKLKKYKPDTLDGWPLIVALYSHDAWDHELAAAIAYGTSVTSIGLAENPDGGPAIATGVWEELMTDGIWNDERGNHRGHLAAIWIFNSWDTANDLPLLAINPFLEDPDIKRAIPKRMRDVSVVCRPKPDDKTLT